jgi:hypothetical protein
MRIFLARVSVPFFFVFGVFFLVFFIECVLGDRYLGNIYFNN